MKKVNWRALSALLVCGHLLGTKVDAATIDCGVGVESVRSFFVPPRTPPGGASWTLGKKRVLYMIVKFVDDQAAPETIEESKKDLQEAGETLARMSYGQYTIEGVVTPVLELPTTSSSYEDRRDELQADARATALKAGFNTDDYDLDIVRHSPVPGYSGGYGWIGRKGAWTQVAGQYVLVHEFGHNLGLYHANFWDTGTPSTGPKISPPFPSNTNEGREGHEFDPDSWIGHESIIGLGQSREYGDIFDVMGGGDTPMQFNASYKLQLGWFSTNQLQNVSTSGVYRLFAFDADTAAATNNYVIKVDKRAWLDGDEKRYWLQYKGGPSIFPDVANGIQVHWRSSGVPVDGPSLLLDMTPGSMERQVDSSLPVGKTFADRGAGIFITPINRSQKEVPAWMDVAVHLGNVATNRAPTIVLTASGTNTISDKGLEFVVTATDPDGNQIAYSWDFGDGTPSVNTNRVEHIWTRDGEFVVRCEVTDLRGGVAAKHLVVRVGTVKGASISGFVRDQEGHPVIGARVHNGKTYRNAEDSEHVMTFTDSDGAYTLANLKPGVYTNAAYLHGWRITANTIGGADVNGSNATNINFTAHVVPTITMEPSHERVVEGQGDTFFRFTRTGPTNESLAVRFTISGTAQPRQDYVDFFIRRVVFAPGERSIKLPFNTIADEAIEGEEELILNVQYPTEMTRPVVEEGKTNLVTFYYPGWELLPSGNEMLWFQTYPDFLPGAGSVTSVKIVDPVAATLTWQRTDPQNLMLSLSAPNGTKHTLERSKDLFEWFPQSTYLFSGNPIELPIVLQTNGPAFYRLRQAP